MERYLFSHIADLVTRQAQRHGAHPAIEGPDDLCLSYAALAETAGRIGETLSRHGVGHRSRVAIVLPNGPEMAVILLAVPMAAAIAAPLNPGYRPGELRDYFAALRVGSVIVPADGGVAAREVAAEMGLTAFEMALDGTVELRHADGPSREPVPPVTPSPDDLAAVFLTSGSTGLPKKVPLTHRNLCYGAAYIANSLNLAPEDRLLAILEQFHVSGPSSQLLAPLSAGTSVVCARDFSAQTFFDLLQACRPTYFEAVPTQLYTIMAHAHRHRPDPVSSLRLIRCIAAALPLPLMEEAEAFFGVRAIDVYGMTEAGPPLTSPPLPPAPRKPGSVGRSVGPEIRIVAPDGRTLGPGEVGEVIARGPNIVTHYEDDPEGTAQTFQNGWYHTGDAGYLDEDGDLFLTGRLKQMINRGGETVNPQEIDNVLVRHPDVAQAACFAVPHRTMGEAIAAAVVAKPGARPDPQELRRFVRQHLSDFKVPQRVILMEAIPLGSTGKYDRRALSAMAYNLTGAQALEETGG